MALKLFTKISKTSLSLHLDLYNLRKNGNIREESAVVGFSLISLVSCLSRKTSGFTYDRLGR